MTLAGKIYQTAVGLCLVAFIICLTLGELGFTVPVVVGLAIVGALVALIVGGAAYALMTSREG